MFLFSYTHGWPKFRVLWNDNNLPMHTELDTYIQKGKNCEMITNPPTVSF